MNFFSSDAFLTALAEVYFPGHSFRIGVYRLLDRLFRLLSIDGHSPIVRWDFLDSVDSMDTDQGTEEMRRLRYLPLAVLESREIVRVPESEQEGPDYFPAPYIDWSRFRDWPAFERHFVARRASLPRDSRQKRRHLERDVGPLHFVWHDPRPGVFERCISWKSAQYVRTGVRDMFHRHESQRFFHALADRDALVISSFSAGDCLLAVHMGGLADERFYSWIAAYDPDHARYSPGRLLLESILKESLERGHREFDFGIGASGYKWHYATHNRTVGPLGTPPARIALTRAFRHGVKRALSRCPGALALVQRARGSWRDGGFGA